MPDGIAALRQIGVELGLEHGSPFRGIRFLDKELEAEASFSYNGDLGFGIRRTLLHRILMERAEDAGVLTCWQTRVEALDPSGVKIDGQTVLLCARGGAMRSMAMELAAIGVARILKQAA